MDQYTSGRTKRVLKQYQDTMDQFRLCAWEEIKKHSFQEIKQEILSFGTVILQSSIVLMYLNLTLFPIWLYHYPIEITNF